MSRSVTRPAAFMRRGIAAASALAAAGGLVLGFTAGPVAAVASGSAERTALVLYTTWGAGNGSPAAPGDVTLSQLTSKIGVADKSWYLSVSHGQFPGWRATGIGPLNITAPRMGADGLCGAQFETDVQTSADAAATARGLDPSKFSTVVYYFSGVPNCPWSGLSDGHLVWLNGTLSTGTTVQELGHTLQLGHGLSLRCHDASGGLVALSSTCDLVRYGDPYNAMGSGSGSFSAIQQNDVGWMSGRVQDIAAVGGNYTIAPIESDPVALQALRVPDGDGTLWIEYRQPIGVDSSLVPSAAGVLIFRQMPDQGTKSILLDMSPDGNFGDSHLPVGQTFVTPSGNRVTVTSSDASGAHLSITTPFRTVPNVVGMAQLQATTALRNAGFNVSAGTQVDPVCNHLGHVLRQTPLGGTVLAQGSLVSIYVGTRPPGGCA